MEQRGEGWVLFAGIMLGLGGIMKIFDAIWAFSYHGVLPSNLEAAIFGHSLVTYGWIDVIVAAILLISAVAVVADRISPGGLASSLQRSRGSAPSTGCRSTRCGRSSTCFLRSSLSTSAVYGGSR